MTKSTYTDKIFTNEDVFTAATHRYINANYPALRHFYYHIPNESATNDLMRIKMAAMGVLPGVPDFCFLKPAPGWYLELKVFRGRLSDKQGNLHQLWEKNGIKVHTAYNAKEVCLILENQNL
jgi:hypothetical protein